MGRLIFLVLGIVCASCLDPTQITVHITTSYTCGDTKTGILVGGESVLSGGSFTATKDACLSDSEVGKMVVVPSGDIEQEVYLRVLAGVDGTSADTCLASPLPSGSSCIEARRILRFVAHRKLELPVNLDRACVNIKCGPRETCVKGKCGNAVVTDPTCIDDPSTCPDAGPPVEVDSGADAPKPIATARLIAAGFDQACAVRASDDALICWTRTKAPSVVTLPVKIGAIKYVAIGNQHTCASDGAVVTCWGSDAKGQVGGPQPVALKSVTAIGALVAGETFTCALDVTNATHTTRCWGAVLDDPMRVQEKIVYPLGTAIPYDQSFDDLAAGMHHICGYTAPGGSGNLFCWGDNAKKQVAGSLTQTSLLKPTLTPLQTPTTVIGAGFDHTGAGGPVTDMNNFHTTFWGAGLVTGIAQTAKQIAFTETTACVIDGGAVRCTDPNNTFVTLGFSTPLSIAAGRAFVCALDSTGRVWCEGDVPSFPMAPNMVEIVLPN